jgi:hypothetical protein
MDANDQTSMSPDFSAHSTEARRLRRCAARWVSPRRRSIAGTIGSEEATLAEEENGRLRRIIADLTPDEEILQEATRDRSIFGNC